MVFSGSRLVDVVVQVGPRGVGRRGGRARPRHVVANVRARARRDGDRVVGVGVGVGVVGGVVGVRRRRREGVVGCAARDGAGGHGDSISVVDIVVVDNVVGRARDGRWARDGTHHRTDVCVGCVGDRGGGDGEDNRG
jgi:hypothetical protein